MCTARAGTVFAPPSMNCDSLLDGRQSTSSAAARSRGGRLLLPRRLRPHPGRKKRSSTEADIEVPAQLLRDLFDGVTHMDALEIDADAL